MDFESLRNALYPNNLCLTNKQLEWVKNMTYAEMYAFLQYVIPYFEEDTSICLSMLNTNEEVMKWFLFSNVYRLLGYCGFDGASGKKLHHTDIAPYTTKFTNYVIHDGVIPTTTLERLVHRTERQALLTGNHFLVRNAIGSFRNICNALNTGKAQLVDIPPLHGAVYVNFRQFIPVVLATRTFSNFALMNGLDGQPCGLFCW